jgi:hypothetical protein
VGGFIRLIFLEVLSMRLHNLVPLAASKQAADVLSRDLLHEMNAIADKATDTANNHESVMALYCEIREAVPEILELTENLAPILERVSTEPGREETKSQNFAAWIGRIRRTAALLPGPSREAEIGMTLLLYEDTRKLFLALSAAIGMDQTTLWRKLQNPQAFTIGEANRIVDLLKLSPGEATAAFFPAYARDEAPCYKTG